MPPPANQGSRGALVTWTVVTSILFVTATVFAIYYYVEANKVNEVAHTNALKYADIIEDSALTGEDVTKLKAARSADATTATIQGIDPSMKVLNVALAQRDALSTLIDASKDPDKAAGDAKKAITAAAAAVKSGRGTSSATNLVDFVSSLEKTLADRVAEVDARKAERDAETDKLKKKTEETAAQIDAMNKTIEGIRAEQQKAVGDAGTVGTTKDEQIKQIQAATDQQAKDSQDAQLKLQAQITDGGRKIKLLQSQIDALQNRLGTLRIDPTKPVLQQPDGHIVRLPGGATCFIDLGYGDQISPGLTFEVYDKLEGVPAPGDPTTDENLPRGKASLEVTHVGATSSECRITRMTPGAALSEGDLIVNLVYDKNTKYKFLVFGNFDLARTGKPNPADTEVVKRLITQWGGSIGAEVNVDTDFAVLGSEPVIPSYTKDELNDPVNKAKFDQATADADAYNEIKAKAKELRIPILNQNRFLYFVGYYDQARR